MTQRKQFYLGIKGDTYEQVQKGRKRQKLKLLFYIVLLVVLCVYLLQKGAGMGL